MDTKHRILMTLGSLLLFGVFMFPIWSISLEAPQYPEGIGMNISINNIEGKKPHDLQNINGLNHYIGMQEIVPDSIPELKIMPYVIGFLMVTGVLIGIWGGRKWVMAWVILFLLLAIAGLVDFYIWEYNYGHNLNPDAAVKIPGMTYQPPLIGSKIILNFKAVSLPHIGFLFALASMATGGYICWDTRKKS